MLIYQVYDEQLVACQMSGFRKEGCFAVNADVYCPAKQVPDSAPFSETATSSAQSQTGVNVTLPDAVFRCLTRFLFTPSLTIPRINDPCTLQ